MVGGGPDPQRGCIPGTAIGSASAAMPDPRLPQFPHTASESRWKTTLSSVLCNRGLVVKKKGGLEGGIMD